MREFLARLWASEEGQWGRRFLLGLLLVAVVLLTSLVWQRLSQRRERDLSLPQDTLAALNLDAPPPVDRRPVPIYEPPTPAMQDRLFRGSSESVLREPAPGDARKERAAVREPNVETSPQEKEMLRRYGRFVNGEYKRMGSIIGRYQKKYPVIRRYHNDLQSISEYRRVEQEYWKDKDLYKWARKTFRLKSVREHVWKYAKQPQMWQAGVQITLDYLKNPPPKPFYDEAKRVMTTDSGVQDFYTEFWSYMLQNVGSITSGEGLPPGTDMSPLHRFITDMSPGAPDAQVRANVALDKSQKSPRPRASQRQGR